MLCILLHSQSDFPLMLDHLQKNVTCLGVTIIVSIIWTRMDCHFSKLDHWILWSSLPCCKAHHTVVFHPTQAHLHIPYTPIVDLCLYCWGTTYVFYSTLMKPMWSNVAASSNGSDNPLWKYNYYFCLPAVSVTDFMMQLSVMHTAEIAFSNHLRCMYGHYSRPLLGREILNKYCTLLMFYKHGIA